MSCDRSRDSFTPTMTESRHITRAERNSGRAGFWHVSGFGYRMERTEWDAVTKPKLIGFVVGMVLFGALVLCSEPGFVCIVDHANLLFHEAGHPILGLFSDRLETYGGTIGQLVFPIALAVSFWRKGQTLSFAGAVIWFFENWLNIARYLADARAQVLPLVGGGDHDWHRILARWHLLEYDAGIAAVIKTLGWVGMFAAAGWIFWRAGQTNPTRDSAARPNQDSDMFDPQNIAKHFGSETKDF